MRPTKYHVISSVAFPFGSVIFQPLSACARHFNRMTRRGDGFFWRCPGTAAPLPFLLLTTLFSGTFRKSWRSMSFLLVRKPPNDTRRAGDEAGLRSYAYEYRVIPHPSPLVDG